MTRTRTKSPKTAHPAKATQPTRSGVQISGQRTRNSQADTTSALSDMSHNMLLKKIADDKDRDAFIILFNHFAPRLKTYLMKLGANDQTAEELVQETMLSVWQNAHSFKPEQANAATWIFTIARNKRIDALRRENRPEPDLNDPALTPDHEPDATDKLAAEEQSSQLQDALTQLPDEQADLLKLAYFSDMTQSEIAAKTQLPLGTVKSRMRLALRRLRKLLHKGGGNED